MQPMQGGGVHLPYPICQPEQAHIASREGGALRNTPRSFLGQWQWEGVFLVLQHIFPPTAQQYTQFIPQSEEDGLGEGDGGE